METIPDPVQEPKMETLKEKANSLIVEHYQNIEKFNRLMAKADALTDKLENSGDDQVTIDLSRKLADTAKGMMRLKSKFHANRREIKQVKALLKTKNGPH